MMQIEKQKLQIVIRENEDQREMLVCSPLHPRRRSTSGMGSYGSRKSTSEASSADCSGRSVAARTPWLPYDNEQETTLQSHPSRWLDGILERKKHLRTKTLPLMCPTPRRLSRRRSPRVRIGIGKSWNSLGTGSC